MTTTAWNLKYDHDIVNMVMNIINITITWNFKKTNIMSLICMSQTLINMFSFMFSKKEQSQLLYRRDETPWKVCIGSNFI